VLYLTKQVSQYLLSCFSLQNNCLNFIYRAVRDDTITSISSLVLYLSKHVLQFLLSCCTWRNMWLSFFYLAVPDQTSASVSSIVLYLTKQMTQFHSILHQSYCNRTNNRQTFTFCHTYNLKQVKILHFRRDLLDNFCAVVQLNIKRLHLCNYSKYSSVEDCTVCTVLVQ
jgi:hypothetical protein